MNLRTRISRTTRRTAAVLAASALLVAPVSLLSGAEAKTPAGSRAQIILETKNVTGQPYYASLNGWWGHQGGKQDKGVGPTYLSLDASDGKGVVSDKTIAALHKKLGDGGSFDSLRVAFVPFSADGHNERPRVKKGQNAGQVFTWFSDLGFGGTLNGTKTSNDLVTWVSTLGEYTKWWQAGRPVQGVNKTLQVLDTPNGGSAHKAAAPEGKSILNRWPAGTKISLVFYVSDGVDKAMPQIPTVKVGPDGRAMTAWMTFKTVASPTNAARTSGGYQVLTGAGTGPKAAAKPKSTATGQTSSSTATPGTKGSSKTSTEAVTKTAADRTSDDGGFTSSLPGGKPTFWVLLVLVVVGIAAGATLRLRSSSSS